MVEFSTNKNALTTYVIGNHELPNLENITIGNNPNDVMIQLKFPTLTIKPTFNDATQSVTIPTKTIKFTLGVQHINNQNSYTSIMFTIDNPELIINNGNPLNLRI